MKKGLSILLIVILVLAILIGIPIRTYNRLVTLQTDVETKQADVQTQLQRRADLIPNFVSTVKGYADYEKETLQAIIEARAGISSAKTVEEQQANSDKLDRAIGTWINAVAEAYPDLKANTQFTALTYELAGTENRVATARRDYNAAVKSYNTAIKRFPANIIANMFGFEAASFFETAAENTTVPQVNF